MTLLGARYRDDPGARLEDEETCQGSHFGAWQPLFLLFSPEWLRNLEFPSMEPREGMFIFWVSVGKVWRLIAMPSDATLDDLAHWILKSVEFNSDHLFEFTYRDQLGAECPVLHSEMDESPWADQVSVEELPLESGETMTFLFAFGDNWKFTVKLERVEPWPRGKQKRPPILESYGKAPEQYHAWDE
jgi:hypothetical protein